MQSESRPGRSANLKILSASAYLSNYPVYVYGDMNEAYDVAFLQGRCFSVEPC
jgi:hypothetical protein